MSITEHIAAARTADDLAVLEGLHPLKHALRFGAQVTTCVVEDGLDLVRAAETLAPDLVERLPVRPEAVDPDTFATLCRHRPAVPVLAIARRPTHVLRDVLARPGPVVLLEDPVHLGNLGAVIRVAAAADATAVLTTGRADPWHPAAVRGAAGLQFAVPVLRVDDGPLGDRPIVAFDPDGEPWGRSPLPDRPVLAFGTERAGLSQALRQRADRVVAITMRSGVSSLNLATSAAIALYAGR